MDQMQNGGSQVKIGYGENPKRRKERIISLNAREPDIYIILLSLIQKTCHCKAQGKVNEIFKSI